MDGFTQLRWYFPTLPDGTATTTSVIPDVWRDHLPAWLGDELALGLIDYVAATQDVRIDIEYLTYEVLDENAVAH